LLLGVIPARGGSVTIKRKCLYPLNGIPLIAYTIKAAQASRLDDFIVTTDDEEIAQYSESLGCTALREPPMGQGEPGAIVRSVQWAIKEYERDGEYVDAVCLLQPTSPLRTAEDIDGALSRFKEAYPCSCVVSVYNGIHPKKSYDGAAKPFFFTNHPYDKHRDQCWTRNGAAFVIRRSVLDGGRLYNKRPVLYVMPKTRSIDIDDMEDMAIAEALLQRQARERLRERKRTWDSLSEDERRSIAEQYSRDIEEENTK
jgi:CMP-N,N'-diacetyllegionaminic acid synthase